MNSEIFLEKVYSEITENIKFSEAKNAALITFNSTLIGLGGNMIFDRTILSCYRVFISFFLLTLGVPLVCAIFSFRATTGSERKLACMIYDFLDKQNKISAEPKKYMYFAYIYKYFANDSSTYLQNILSLTDQDQQSPLLQQIAIQIIDLSRIAYQKFTIFNFAMKIEFAIFGCFGIVSFIVLIF